MKKILLPFIALILFAALFAILGSFGSWDKISAFGSGEKAKNIIYIGVYEPLTGDYSQGGLSEALGIRYANSVCPTVDIAGVTYDIKLVEADCGDYKEGSAIPAQALVKSGVCAVLGSYSAKETNAGLTVFEENGIPLLGVSCSSRSATEGSSVYFRMCCTDSLQSGIMANFASSMDLKHAALLTQTGDEYSKETGKVFTEAFKKLGGEVTDFSFQLGQENFRSLAKEISNSDADFVVMLSGAFEASYFISQSRNEGLVCPILGLENWDSALLLNDVSSSSGKIYFASEFDSSKSADPVSAEFADSYSTWISKDAQRLKDNGSNDYTSTASATAYDGYMMIVEAIKAADSSDPQAITAALRTLKYEGVTGSISFDENGEAVKKQVFIKTIDLSSKQFEVLQTSSVGG